MREKILKILRNADGYVSGQKLCETLGVSRTAVWKAIGQLREEGYAIEAVTNRGYRLQDPQETDILNQEELEEAFHTRWAGHPLLYTQQTGSTNDDIMALSDQGYPQGTVTVASEQTKGKGRRGRTWVSPAQGNVYTSILLRPKMDPSAAPQSTLVIALAAREAILDLGVPENVKVGIKWPNDVVLSKDGGPYRKCCGILTEMRLEETEIRDVTIGIGLNINEESFSEEIRETATSLKLAFGRTISRANLTALLWEHFEEDYEQFEKTEDLSGVKAAYESGLVNIGREVRVLDPKGEYTGMAKGITDHGELIVVPTGSERAVLVANGEISVRGVMGYV